MRPPVQSNKLKSGSSSSNQLSYTTSIDRLQYNQDQYSKDNNQLEQRGQRLQHKRADLDACSNALNKLHNFMMKKVVIAIAEHAFSPQQD